MVESPVIRASKLIERFGDLVAVVRLHLEVVSGEGFGFWG